MYYNFCIFLNFNVLPFSKMPIKEANYKSDVDVRFIEALLWV